MFGSVSHHINFDCFREVLEVALVFELFQKLIGLGLWQWRVKKLNLDDVIAFFPYIHMHWSVREVTEPWNLVRDHHAIEWELVEETMLVHFAGYDVCVEFRNETSWTMVLNDLDNTLCDLFILDDFLFKSITIEPLDFRNLRSLLRDEVMRKFIIHELVDELIQFLLRLGYIENETLILFKVEIITACTGILTFDSIFDFHFLL